MKDNNPAYGDIVIDGSRLQNLPEDGELPNLRTVEFSETERVDDQGPAPQQLDAGETNGTDDVTVSGIILPEPGVNVQAQVEAAINEVVSEPSEGEAEGATTSNPLADYRYKTSVGIYYALFFHHGVSLLVSIWKG